MLKKGRRVGTPLFADVLKRGLPVRSPSFTARVLPTPGQSKASIVVPKRAAPLAVPRAALRRRYRAALPPLLDALTRRAAIVFFIQRPISQREFAAEAASALKKAGFL